MSQASRVEESNRAGRSRSASGGGGGDEVEEQLPPAVVAAWLKYREEGELDWTRRWVRITEDTFDMHLSRGDPTPLHSFRLSDVFIGTVGGRAFKLLHGDEALEYRCCDDIEYDEVIAALLARARHGPEGHDGPDWQAMYAEALERQKELENQLKKERAAAEHAKREKARLDAELGHSRDLPALHQKQLDALTRQHRQAMEDLKRENSRLEADLGQSGAQASADRLELQELERKLEATQAAHERSADDQRQRIEALEDELSSARVRLKQFLDAPPSSTQHAGVQCALGRELEVEWKLMYRRIVPTADASVQVLAPQSGSSGSQTDITGAILSASDADLLKLNSGKADLGTQTTLSGETVTAADATNWYQFAALSAKLDEALRQLRASAPCVHPTTAASHRSSSAASRPLAPARNSSGITRDGNTAGATRRVSVGDQVGYGFTDRELEDGVARAGALMQSDGRNGSAEGGTPPALLRQSQSFADRAQELRDLLAEVAASQERAVNSVALHQAIGELQACQRFLRPAAEPSATQRSGSSATEGRPHASPDVRVQKPSKSQDPASQWRRAANSVSRFLNSDPIASVHEQVLNAAGGTDEPTAEALRRFLHLRQSLTDAAAAEAKGAAQMSDWEERVRAALLRLSENTAAVENPAQPLDVAAKQLERIAPELTDLCTALVAEEPWPEHPLANQLCNAMAELFATFYLRLQQDTREFLRHHRGAESIARFALALKRAGQILQPIKGCEMFAAEFQANWPIVAELVELPRRVVLEDAHFARLRAWIAQQDNKRRVRLSHTF